MATMAVQVPCLQVPPHNSPQRARMVLTPSSAAKAKEELNEPEDAAAVVAALRARVLAAQGDEEARRWEWALAATLRQVKWDADRAFEKLSELSAFAAKRPHLFAALNAQEFVGQATIGVTSHLPTRNNRGELVLLLNGEAMSELAREHTMQDMLRYSVFYMTHLMQDEETQVNGVVIVENLHNYPMMALNRMKGVGPTGMKASFEWLKVSPMRLRGIYAIRQPWYVGVMLAMVKPFMSAKLRERVALFGADTSGMLAAAGLTPEQLPPEYGGTLQGFDTAWHLKEMLGRQGSRP